MPRWCSAFGCSNSNDKVECKEACISFHTFPKDAQLRREWAIATKRKNFVPGSSAVLCSKHFSRNWFIPGISLRKLYPNAVPTIFTELPEYMQGKQPRNSAIEKRVVANILSSSVASNVTAATSQESSEENDDESTLCESDVEDENENLKRDINNLKKEVSAQSRIILRLRRRLRFKRHQRYRLRKRIRSLDSIVSVLQKKNLITSQTAIDLRGQYEDSSVPLMQELLRRRSRPKEYSSAAQNFAGTLFYKSPSAYKFVSRLLRLPSPSTLRSWLSNHLCYPGFIEPAFMELKTRCSNTDFDESSRYKFCSVVVDEMTIKKQVQWCPSSGQFVGYVNMGNGEESTQIASGAYCIMAVGLLGHWKIPLAYFLIHGLTSDVIATLVKETLIRLHNAGVTGLSVTFDGASTQIAAMEELGADLSLKYPRPFFQHPCDKSINVTTVLDACHMVKLVRNALQYHQSFSWTEKSGSVKWELLDKLVKLQESHDLRAGNKITAQHIDFHNKKMKVCLATQLFSKSVADALRFCLHFL